MKTTIVIPVVFIWIIVTLSLIHILIVNAINTTEEKKNWETFKNTDYGFSIEYPKEWEAHSHFEKDSQVVKFYNFGFDNNSDLHSMNATLLIKPKNVTLIDYIDKQYLINPMIKKIEEPISITIAGNPGYIYNVSSLLPTETSFKEAVFAHGNYFYNLNVNGLGDLYRDFLFNHMLGSIKFMN